MGRVVLLTAVLLLVALTASTTAYRTGELYSTTGYFIIDKGDCPQFCPAVVDPVCGSDGVTYQNLCHLTIENCEQGGGIYKVRDGPCSTGSYGK